MIVFSGRAAQGDEVEVEDVGEHCAVYEVFGVTGW